MKENLHTKYFPFTYNDVALNEKPPIMKENLCIFIFIIGGVECICYLGQIIKNGTGFNSKIQIETMETKIAIFNIEVHEEI